MHAKRRTVLLLPKTYRSDSSLMTRGESTTAWQRERMRKNTWGKNAIHNSDGEPAGQGRMHLLGSAGSQGCNILPMSRESGLGLNWGR